MWDRRCQITGVHDGDTLSVYTDDGKKEFSAEDIRLFAVFAPELSQFGGEACKAFVREWVRQHDDGSQWPFIVETMRNRGNTAEQKTFDRYVAMIYTRDRLFNLNVEVTNFVRAQGFPGGTGS